MFILKKIPKFFFLKLKEKPLLEQEFSRENLKSERLRSLVILIFSLIISLFLVTISLQFSYLFPQSSRSLYLGLNLQSWMAIIFTGVAVYEFFFLMMLTYFIKYRLWFPMLPRIGNALFEVSIPTILIYFSSKVFQTYEPLFSPAVFIYFLFITLSALRLNPWLCIITGAAASAEYLALAYYLISRSPVPHDSNFSLFTSSGIHFSRGMVLLFAGIATAFVAIQIKKRLIRSFKTLEDRNRIVGIFGQHVSPEVVNTLIEAGEKDSGEIRDICVMFLDIRNFTGFTEGKSPDAVINYLNGLFSFMVDIINRHHGIINKFLGDGFMAVFGAPISDGNDANNAVLACLEIISRLDDEIREGRIPETRIGIGLHAGMAMTGTVGSDIRKEYTIIGDIVNLASRIEQLNKRFGSSVLISDEVYKRMSSITTESVDLGFVEIRGHIGEIHIYRLA